jgi:putative phosphoesterase
LPKIALLSDSHGRAAITRRAVQLALTNGAETILHLGDIGSTDVIDALRVDQASAGRAVESRLVFGNVDAHWRTLAEHAKRAGLVVDHPVGWLELAGGDLVYLHGDDEDAKAEALAAEVRYLCHGHTHQQVDARVRETRVINPGALFRAVEYSIAVLDTDSDALSFYTVT